MSTSAWSDPAGKETRRLIEWRDLTDDKVRQLSGDRPDGQHGDLEWDGAQLSAYRNHPEPGGVIFLETADLSPSAWTADSDEGLSAAWHALTGPAWDGAAGV